MESHDDLPHSDPYVGGRAMRLKSSAPRAKILMQNQRLRAEMCFGAKRLSRLELQLKWFTLIC